MTALRRRHHRRPGTLELTPLVDVALMLVVFLLLSSGMVAEEEEHFEVNLPVTGSGDEVDADQLTLSISASGALYAGSQRLELDELPAVVGEGRGVVVLRADHKSEHGRVMEVIDELRRLRVGTVYHASDRGPEAW